MYHKDIKHSGYPHLKLGHCGETPHLKQKGLVSLEMQGLLCCIKRYRCPQDTK
nr:MAG TPA: hypothetical protein [Caudoviricetes sp.]DAV63534.1 MAG TPA: hypothetical protein [Caudoviricetes sp.]